VILHLTNLTLRFRQEDIDDKGAERGATNRPFRREECLKRLNIDCHLLFGTAQDRQGALHRCRQKGDDLLDGWRDAE